MSGQDPVFVKNAFAKIADRYVTTNHVLSAGTDILWRKKVGRIVAGWQPKRILDVATGTGDLALELQKACPQAEVLATDFCPEMLAHAGKRGVRETEVVDALEMPYEDASFDVVSVAFGLRNMADWKAALVEMNRVLRPGGHLLILDFSTPDGVLAKPYSLYLNQVLPRIAGVLTGEGGAYKYLAGSIQEFPKGKAMISLVESAAFSDGQWIPLTGGIASIYTARK